MKLDVSELWEVTLLNLRGLVGFPKDHLIHDSGTLPASHNRGTVLYANSTTSEKKLRIMEDISPNYTLIHFSP